MYHALPQLRPLTHVDSTPEHDVVANTPSPLHGQTLFKSCARVNESVRAPKRALLRADTHARTLALLSLALRPRVAHVAPLADGP
eukprot:3400842-Pleurochrysis_carterae.AAC.1